MAKLTDTQKRALWIGGLGALLTTTISVIAYASGKSSGSEQCHKTSQAFTLSGAGSFANTYPSGSTVTISLPSGAQWAGTGVSVLTGDFSASSAPSSGSSPAQIVYNGGGGQLSASWVDSNGTPQLTLLRFNG